MDDPNAVKATYVRSFGHQTTPSGVVFERNQNPLHGGATCVS